jgi:hypothetical protein
MSPNTDALRHIPLSLLVRSKGPVKAFGIGSVMSGRNGRFGAMKPKETGKGTHDHVWIFGHENAVCTKCGYTLPKRVDLPQRGQAIGVEEVV